jgi:hypothetical protein
MTCAIILANIWFCVNNRHTSDHQVDALISTIKYMNDPLIGCIGPHISPYILLRNFNGSICILRGKGLKINFSVAHAMHMKLEVLGILVKL